MNILFLEPFYGGSHKKWIDSYQENSSHKIELLTLPGWNWKWRMHGAAITLSGQFIKKNFKPDMVICSDMLNLPVFISILRKELTGIPVLTYFHENQVAYPWSPKDEDVNLKRDIHYYYINQTTALCSDHNLFNSRYNLESFLSGLESDYLLRMPDNQNLHTLETIRKKSSVMYIGCDLFKDKYRNSENLSPPLILWNHRWEFDKNPEAFFNTLFKLKDEKISFQLVVLGQSYRESPDIFNRARSYLENEIVHFGYCESHDEYLSWLSKSDILPVTSNQDFFGISIVEAAYMKTLPLLPNRLSYPEIFDIDKNPEIFYDSDSQLYDILKSSIENIDSSRKKAHEISKPLARFSWEQTAKEYDDKLLILHSQIMDNS